MVAALSLCVSVMVVSVFVGRDKPAAQATAAVVHSCAALSLSVSLMLVSVFVGRDKPAAQTAAAVVHS